MFFYPAKLSSTVDCIEKNSSLSSHFFLIKSLLYRCKKTKSFDVGKSQGYNQNYIDEIVFILKNVAYSYNSTIIF